MAPRNAPAPPGGRTTRADDPVVPVTAGRQADRPTGLFGRWSIPTTWRAVRNEWQLKAGSDWLSVAPHPASHG
jgi:hypothetical protein